MRSDMAALLNTLLADAINLQLQAKHAHWNVKGDNFMSLHMFFDDLHEVVEGFVDTLAERATALGGVADGRITEVSRMSRLPAYPDDVQDGLSHLRVLANSFDEFRKSICVGMQCAEKAGDIATLDVCTEICREVDKQSWFIRQGFASAPNKECSFALSGLLQSFRKASASLAEMRNCLLKNSQHGC